MSVLDDLMTAIDAYETDKCDTQIVNFSITGSGGTVLNVGETFQFRVKVSNQGHLDMRNVKVRVNGTQFADVSLSAGSFSGTVVTDPFPLASFQSHTTGIFRGKAKIQTNGAKDIVTARIEAWDASFDHLLADHTGAGVAEGKLNKNIALT